MSYDDGLSVHAYAALTDYYTAFSSSSSTFLTVPCTYSRYISHGIEHLHLNSPAGESGQKFHPSNT